jgi:hypothetical protein
MTMIGRTLRQEARGQNEGEGIQGTRELQRHDWGNIHSHPDCRRASFCRHGSGFLTSTTLDLTVLFLRSKIGNSYLFLTKSAMIFSFARLALNKSTAGGIKPRMAGKNSLSSGKNFNIPMFSPRQLRLSPQSPIQPARSGSKRNEP